MNRLRVLTIVAAAAGLGLVVAFFWLPRTRSDVQGNPGLAPRALTESPTAEPSRMATNAEILAGSAGTPRRAANQTEEQKLIATAVGKGDARDFRSRLDALARLDKDLSEEAIQMLYAYLRDPAEESDLRPGQAFALKNEILNVLRDQKTAPPTLTRVLTALCKDESQPLVIRDYALQHLAPWYLKIDATQREQVVLALTDAAQEINQSYAGTALLALDRIRREQSPSSDLPALDSLVLELLNQPTANLLARISAVQLSGDLHIQSASESLETMARDEQAPPTLRIAATRALGGMESPNVPDFLQGLLRTDDSRLAMAAQAALNARDELGRTGSKQ